MKTLFLAVASLLIALPITALDARNALAAGSPADRRSCQNIGAACRAAGFSKGAHKSGNKGLIEDCIRPIMNGQPVAGVGVNPSDVQACKAYRAKRKAGS